MDTLNEKLISFSNVVSRLEKCKFLSTWEQIDKRFGFSDGVFPNYWEHRDEITLFLIEIRKLIGSNPLRKERADDSNFINLIKLLAAKSNEKEKTDLQVVCKSIKMAARGWCVFRVGDQTIDFPTMCDEFMHSSLIHENLEKQNLWRSHFCSDLVENWQINTILFFYMQIAYCAINTKRVLEHKGMI